MIRLAISCDICGEEKKQTNHWFVAYEHSGELRIGSWKSRYCKRSGSRHLCGQTCLHKLVDEFMAQTIAEDREIAAAEQAFPEPLHIPQAAPAVMPTTLEPAVQQSHMAAQNFVHAAAGYEDEYGSSARLISMPANPGGMQSARPEPSMPSNTETPKYLSHQWRTSAWERERKREMHGR